MGHIKASEALEIYKRNEARIKTEEELEKQRKLRDESEQQKIIDGRWIEKTIKFGDQIISYIIEYGPMYGCGLGESNATNGYLCELSSYSGKDPFRNYSFYDLVSDDAVNKVKEHFNNLGYGCKVEKAKENGLHGCAYDIQYGTMYLWIPTEKEQSATHDVGGEISW